MPSICDTVVNGAIVCMITSLWVIDITFFVYTNESIDDTFNRHDGGPSPFMSAFMFGSTTICTMLLAYIFYRSTRDARAAEEEQRKIEELQQPPPSTNYEDDQTRLLMLV